MKLDELQTRLTHLLTALSNEDSRIIQGFTKAFIEDSTPNQTWVISLTEIEGYDKPLIELTNRTNKIHYRGRREGWSYTRYQTFQASQYIP